MPSKHSRNNQNNYGGKKSKTRHRRLPAAGGNIPNTIPRGRRLAALAAGGAVQNHPSWGAPPILGIPNPFTMQYSAGPTPFYIQPAAGGHIPDTIPRGSQLAALAAGGAVPNHQGLGWRAPILGIPNPFTIQHPAAAGPTPFHMQPAAGGYIPDTIPRGRQLAALAAGSAAPNHRGWGWQAQDNLGRNIIPDIPNPFTMQSAAAAGPTPFRIRSRRSASAERKSRHNKKHGKKD